MCKLKKVGNGWRSKRSSELDALRASKRWRELRESILREQPLCVVCIALGRKFPAAEVHHIVPAAEMVKRYGEEGFYIRENLVPLCRRCHDRNENAWKTGTAGIVFGRK